MSDASGAGFRERRASIVHLLLHIIVPALVTALFFRQNWKKTYGAMMLTMLVDIDHLTADPIYDPNRCSIGTHPLHGPVPIVLYGLACFWPKARLFGIGLVIHTALDALDCRWTNGVWFVYP